MAQVKKELTDLENIGRTLCKKLSEIGVHSISDLKIKGPVKAYVELCQAENKRLPVCYYLYSLEGALKNKNWRSLSDKTKQQLLAKVEKY